MIVQNRPTLFDDPGAPAPTRTETELLHDATDAAAMLAMGPEGIAASVAARLRVDLLDAAKSLAGLWGLA